MTEVKGVKEVKEVKGRMLFLGNKKESGRLDDF